MTMVLVALFGALIGSAATLAAGWWARQAGRRGAELAEAANDRAALAEHRAAVAELLAAAYALSDVYSRHIPNPANADQAELLARLRLAANRVMWPSSSPMSATVAHAVYVYALTAGVRPPGFPGGDPGAFWASLGLFTEAAEAEAGCQVADRQALARYVALTGTMVSFTEAVLALETAG